MKLELDLINGEMYKVRTVDGTLFAAKYIGKTDSGRLVFQSRTGIVSAHLVDDIVLVIPVEKLIH